MALPQAVRQGRKARGLSQSNTGIPLSQQMVSAIESGTRPMARDVMPIAAEQLDYPAVLMEIARESTAGFGPAWLNGENVDLHRSAVREKCLEELREAIEAIDESPSNLPPIIESERDMKRRIAHLMQVMDAAQACYIYVGVQCEEYGYSMLRLNKEHYAKLKGKRYVEG